MSKRIDANITMLNPEDFMKNWMSFGTGAQEQFRKLMDVATTKK